MHLPVLVAENALFKAVGQIFHPLFVAIASALAAVYSVVPTYSVAIIVLTVVIMALLTPLTVKSTRSMLAMQVLQPEMQKLRAKYKGPENRQQLNEEMMKLYKEHGVSPTGGCLPMFLQMPAFIVLYDVIRGLANTVKRGTLLGTGVKKCTATVCATPRYVPHGSAIYHDLLKTPGVMHSIGLNLAAKPLTHRANWYDYIPYFALVLAAVALQYFQMAQMTRRNKKSGTAQQVPKQMQSMQRIMPLIFAYIYFLVPAGVAVYMVVSSAIRVVTQDVMFRYGLVQKPGEREVGAKKPTGGAVATRPSLVQRAKELAPEKKGAPAAPEKKGAPAAPARAAQPSDAEKRVGTGTGTGARTGTGRSRPGQRGARANGTTRGSTPEPEEPKAHPRSKSKRARRPR